MIMTTDAEVMQVMRDVVEGNENFVYPHSDPYNPRCVYVEDGAPSCLIGHVLHRLGVSIDVLRDADLGYSGGGKPAPDLAEGVLDGVTEGLLLALGHAQRCQDGGDTWGAALGFAEEYFANYVDDGE